MLPSINEINSNAGDISRPSPSRRLTQSTSGKASGNPCICSCYKIGIYNRKTMMLLHICIITPQASVVPTCYAKASDFTLSAAMFLCPDISKKCDACSSNLQSHLLCRQLIGSSSHPCNLLHVFCPQAKFGSHCANLVSSNLQVAATSLAPSHRH